ncbi:MAG: ribosome assembly RNA-binding protein YhbY [Erysipelotrichaceae bacterium]
MLNKKEKQFLRSQAQTLRPLFQMGKDGLTENFIATLEDSIYAHELVKINLLKTCPLSANEAAIEVARLTDSEVIQVIGRTFVVFRQSKKNKYEL